MLHKQSAPLYEALQALVTRDTLRFHMPGHKGKPVFAAFAEIFALDYTETYNTGNLYEGTGPIRDAEQLAAAYYGAQDCHFLTGGSTQGAQAMLYAAAAPGGTVLLDRTAHKSACSACALFGLTPQFIYPDTLQPFGCGGALNLAQAEQALQAHPDAKALFITSPNYYGVIQDIPALSEICHRLGRLLLVDAAHGAHLPALGIPSPVQAGADAAVLSAHKTLPALGQGALLLFGKGLSAARLREGAEMVGTSSPSYPIMASIDLSRAWLEGIGRRLFRTSAKTAAQIREAVEARTPFTALTGDSLPAFDPCRLTVCAATAGISGHALAAKLYRNHGIACEMADARCVVFILTGTDRPLDLYQLRRALIREGRTLTPSGNVPPLLPLPPAEAMLSVHDAWFAPRKDLPLSETAGHICARAVTPYPPGVPVLWPGEKITDAHIEFLHQRCYTDKDKISVICHKVPHNTGGGFFYENATCHHQLR